MSDATFHLWLIGDVLCLGLFGLYVCWRYWRT